MTVLVAALVPGAMVAANGCSAPALGRGGVPDHDAAATRPDGTPDHEAGATVRCGPPNHDAGATRWDAACADPSGKSSDIRLTARGLLPIVGSTPAWSGDGFGFAFTGATEARHDRSGDRVYFQALTATGTRDRAIVQISSDTHAQDPAVAFGGSHFGVVWHDDAGVRFASIDPTSHTVSTPITLAPGPQDERATPRVVWASDRFGVVWWGHTSPGSVTAYFAPVTPDGAPMDAPTTVFSDATGQVLLGGSLLWNCPTFVLSAPGTNGVHLAFFDIRGSATSTLLSGIKPNGIPDIHVDSAGELVVAWQPYTQPMPLMLQRVDMTGAPLGPPERIADFAANERLLSNVGLGPNDLLFVVGDDQHTEMARAKLGETPVRAPLSADPTTWATVTWTNGQFAIARQPRAGWSDQAVEILMTLVGGCPSTQTDSPTECLVAAQPSGSSFACRDITCAGGLEYCEQDTFSGARQCRPAPAGCGPSCGWIAEADTPKICGTGYGWDCAVDARGNVTVSCNSK